jgi:hypothetical protein
MTASGELSFLTELVGIPEDGGLPVPLASFEWTDTFNGDAKVAGTGGITLITITPDIDLLPDPESGTGGITLVDINGEPVSAVPEPPTFTLLCPTLLYFFMRLSARRFRPT